MDPFISSSLKEHRCAISCDENELASSVKKGTKWLDNLLLGKSMNNATISKCRSEGALGHDLISTENIAVRGKGM